MTVVILAHPQDDHAAVISWALREAGHKVLCWSELGWGPEQQVSIQVDSSIELSLGGQPIHCGDVIWIRRPNHPIPNPRIHDADKKFADGEYQSFNRSILHLLERLPVRCINTYSATVSA